MSSRPTRRTVPVLGAELTRIGAALPKMFGVSCECGLCMERFDDTDTLWQLPCRHVFCRGCLAKLRKHQCPTCRAPWAEDDRRSLLSWSTYPFGVFEWDVLYTPELRVLKSIQIGPHTVTIELSHYYESGDVDDVTEIPNRPGRWVLMNRNVRTVQCRCASELVRLNEVRLTVNGLLFEVEDVRMEWEEDRMEFLPYKESGEYEWDELQGAVEHSGAVVVGSEVRILDAPEPTIFDGLDRAKHIAVSVSVRPRVVSAGEWPQ